MFQYIVVPTRRSTAEAIQILISHAFGDAGSPYLIGAVSWTHFMSLSLFTQAHSRASVHSISTVNWRQILNF